MNSEMLSGARAGNPHGLLLTLTLLTNHLSCGRAEEAWPLSPYRIAGSPSMGFRRENGARGGAGEEGCSAVAIVGRKVTNWRFVVILPSKRLSFAMRSQAFDSHGVTRPTFSDTFNRTQRKGEFALHRQLSAFFDLSFSGE